MARRAARELFDRANLVFLDQTRPEVRIVGRTFPIHVEDLVARPHVFLRVAVAVEAPVHHQRGVLVDERHLVDLPVAGGAADALVHVDAVVEIHEIGQIVDPRSSVRGLSSRKLARTGSRIGAFVQICEWQFMHVLVGGMFANADSSTDVWQ